MAPTDVWNSMARRPLRRPCGTATRSTPLRMGSSNWPMVLFTCHNTGSGKTLCQSAVLDQHYHDARKKIVIFQNKPWRGTFTNSCVSGPTSTGDSSHLHRKILKQVMACKHLQWCSFPGSSSLVASGFKKQGRII